jgi:RimJ/RimL family protein N-acetyltransferase
VLPGAGLVGRCGFVFWPGRGPDGAGETEIGWVLDPRRWGQGLAAEAAALDWGFGRGTGQPGLVQVTAMIAPDNVASVSVSVALQLGLRPERDEQLDGKPVRVYTLHRDAWPPPEGPARPA